MAIAAITSSATSNPVTRFDLSTLDDNTGAAGQLKFSEGVLDGLGLRTPFFYHKT